MTIDPQEAGTDGRLDFLHRAPAWVWCLVVVPVVYAVGGWGIVWLVTDFSGNVLPDVNAGMAIGAAALLIATTAFLTSRAIARFLDRTTVAAVRIGLYSVVLTVVYGFVLALVWLSMFFECSSNDGCLG